MASGPSSDLHDPEALSRLREEGVLVVAVNRTPLWLPWFSAHFTLDPDPRTLPILREPRGRAVYFAAVPEDYGTPTARIHYHRTARLPWVRYLRRIAGDGPWGSVEGLSEDPGAIHTGNSAWGALGLAYHMRPERVLLVGVDATPSGYGHGLSGGPRFRSMNHLPDLFRSATDQLREAGIEVRHAAHGSRVTCFPSLAPREALEWIRP